MLLLVVVDGNAFDQIECIAFLVVHFQRTHEQNEDQRHQKHAPNENEERQHFAHESHRVVVAVADGGQGDNDEVENVQIVHEACEFLFFDARVNWRTYSST